MIIYCIFIFRATVLPDLFVAFSPPWVSSTERSTPSLLQENPKRNPALVGHLPTLLKKDHTTSPPFPSVPSVISNNVGQDRSFHVDGTIEPTMGGPRPVYARTHARTCTRVQHLVLYGPKKYGLMRKFERSFNNDVLIRKLARFRVALKSANLFIRLKSAAIIFFDCLRGFLCVKRWGGAWPKMPS